MLTTTSESNDEILRWIVNPLWSCKGDRQMLISDYDKEQPERQAEDWVEGLLHLTAGGAWRFDAWQLQSGRLTGLILALILQRTFLHLKAHSAWGSILLRMKPRSSLTASILRERDGPARRRQGGDNWSFRRDDADMPIRPWPQPAQRSPRSRRCRFSGACCPFPPSPSLVI